MSHLTSISPHLTVLHGSINTGMLLDGNRALLIDCGTEAAEALGERQVDAALLTHYHRDGCCGIGKLASAPVWAPEAERRWLEGTECFWSDPAYRWHLYNYRPSHLVAVENIRVARGLNDGEVITWGPATITALVTPGHTDGGMSYLVEMDGRRVIFSGDLIYDVGRIWELLSLQHGNEKLWDYHAFLGGKDALLTSLRRLLEFAPDALVPTHGVIMADPQEAVKTLAERLEAAYVDYLSANTIRSYFPGQFSSPPGALAVREALPAPTCLRKVATSWVLISRTGAAFVMDCGDPQVIRELRSWQATGAIASVEGLWITHMHDDHVNAIPEFQQTFDCPLYADPAVADVIANPRAWRLPCISPSVARVDHRTGDGERWPWHEFTFTAYNFPGQTLYHGGLLVESAEWPRMFFVGDSFALAGMDDYCAHNRNFIGAGVGFDHCLTLLQKLHPDLLFNPHVEGGFIFSAEEYQWLRDTLAARETSFGELFPWPHANFGTDDFWARCHPYEQDVQPGTTSTLSVVITNHASTGQVVTVRAKSRTGWGDNQPVTAAVPPKAETRIQVTVRVPDGLATGRYAVAVDVTLGNRTLPEFTEMVLVVPA